MMIKDSGCFWIFQFAYDERKLPSTKPPTAQPLNAEEKK